MNKELLKKAIESLSITDVRLDSSEVKVTGDFDPLFPGVDSLTIQYRNRIVESTTKIVKDDDGNEHRIMAARYQCAFRVLPSSIPEEILNDTEAVTKSVLASVTADFIAYYSITEELEQAAIDEFCKFNVGYHVWPYWREYAASTASRLRLPSITVPLYTIPAHKEPQPSTD